MDNTIATIIAVMHRDFVHGFIVGVLFGFVFAGGYFLRRYDKEIRRAEGSKDKEIERITCDKNKEIERITCDKNKEIEYRDKEIERIVKFYESQIDILQREALKTSISRAWQE